MDGSASKSTRTTDCWPRQKGAAVERKWDDALLAHACREEAQSTLS